MRFLLLSLPILFAAACEDRQNVDNAAPPSAPSPSIAVAKSATPPPPAPSQSAVKNCYLAVDGTVHVDGRCRVFPIGDGGYTLNTWDGGKPAASHFAIVEPRGDGTADATWNADPDDDRAYDPLGRLRREGPCWTGERTRICAS